MSENDTRALAIKLEEHIKAYTLHRNEYLERQAHQDTAHEANLKAIKDLTLATQGLVDAWSTANLLQRFVVWVSKFAMLGGIAVYLVSKFGSKIT